MDDNMSQKIAELQTDSFMMISIAEKYGEDL